MSIKVRLEDAVSRLEKTDDYVEISDIGDEIWDLVDEMDASTDPAVLPALGKAMDSDAATYFIEKAVDVVGQIGGVEAEKVLVNVRNDYTDTEDETYLKCGELLASINPKKYISAVDNDAQYQVIRSLVKKEDLDSLKAIIGMTGDGIHLKNKQKMTLIWISLEADNIELCKYLMESGVDATQKNIYGESALEYAVKNGNKSSTYLVQNA
ncbi:hypothetical protein A9Q99_25145 [Gammaproteobacteria bacterium 45_16_T64]|nr:hypothetical protein A9Q99_25145 [Gammaproteobacteria bacterium 45_16_T64]